MDRKLLMVIAGVALGGMLLFLVSQCDPRGEAPPEQRVTGRPAFTADLPEDVDPKAIGTPLPERLLRDLRLVSLSPAMSRALVDLGLEPAIVGRSAFCDFLDPALPVAGDLLRVDAERLVELQPTHVLRQPPANDDPQVLRRLADVHGWAPPITARLDGLADVRGFTRGLVRRLSEPVTPLEAALDARAAVLDERLAALTASRPLAGSESLEGGVLLLYAVRPPGVFGRGTYFDEMLEARGVANAFTGLGWSVIGIEDLVDLDPAAIVLVTDRPETGPDLRASALEAWAGLGLRAVADGRLAVCGHVDALRPSTGLVGAGAVFDAVLTGMLAADADGEDAAVTGSRSPSESTGPLRLPTAPGDRVGPLGAGAGSDAP